MKVLLLQAPDDPASSGYLKFLMPLSLGILISYLRENNFEVKANDLNENIFKNYNDTPKEKWLQVYDKGFLQNCLNNPDEMGDISVILESILEEMNIKEYDFVGISTGAYGSFFEVHFSLLLGKLIKKKYNKPVVFGGVNIGLIIGIYVYEKVLKLFLSHFKYILVGPGEQSLVKLLHSYNDGTIDAIYHTLPGAVYFSNRKVIYNKTDKPTFTCPDYSDFDQEFYKTYFAGNDEDENLRQIYKISFPYTIEINYFLKTFNQNKSQSANVLPYYFNQNCPFNCIFCAQSLIKDKPVTKGVKEVFDDIRILQKKYNTKYFQFINNAINFSPAFVYEFCTMIIESGIKIYWSDCARVNGLTKELIELLYKAGCRKLIFGFETGSKKLLKYTNKNLDLDQVRKVLRWCKETGIYAELEIIIGFPYENNEDFEATNSFILENKENINFIHTNKYYLIGESLIGAYPEKYGIELIKEETYESMLAWAKKLSINNFQPDPEDVGKILFHVLEYSEINGRSCETIQKETHERFLNLISLNTEFPGYTEMEKIRKSFLKKNYVPQAV